MKYKEKSEREKERREERYNSFKERGGRERESTHTGSIITLLIKTKQESNQDDCCCTCNWFDSRAVSQNFLMVDCTGHRYATAIPGTLRP